MKLKGEWKVCIYVYMYIYIHNHVHMYIVIYMRIYTYSFPMLSTLSTDFYPLSNETKGGMEGMYLCIYVYIYT
jgi:hypothetical protein